MHMILQRHYVNFNPLGDKPMKRKIMLALGCLALIATPVLAAGLFPGLPIVGSAAFCSSTNQAGVPGTAPVCTTTTSAGPSIVSGLETIPADTNLPQGQSPQTVKLSLASLNALPVTYVAITPTASSFTETGSVLSGGFILTAAATITPTINFVLPPSPIDGQQFLISTNQTISTMTVTGAGGATVNNAPTVLTVSTTAPFGYKFRFRSATNSWFRLQ